MGQGEGLGAVLPTRRRWGGPELSPASLSSPGEELVLQWEQGLVSVYMGRCGWRPPCLPLLRSPGNLPQQQKTPASPLVPLCRRLQPFLGGGTGLSSQIVASHKG